MDGKSELGLALETLSLLDEVQIMRTTQSLLLVEVLKFVSLKAGHVVTQQEIDEVGKSLKMVNEGCGFLVDIMNAREERSKKRNPAPDPECN